MTLFCASISRVAFPDLAVVGPTDELDLLVADWEALLNFPDWDDPPLPTRTYIIAPSQETRGPAPIIKGQAQPLSAFVRDQRQIFAAVHPFVVWPGAEGGSLHLFHHDDWPGAYGAVNVSPHYWNGQPADLDRLSLRSRLLPRVPMRVTGLPDARTLTACGVCRVQIDRRYAFGHGRWDGRNFVRAGTDGVIAVPGTSTWTGQLEPGPVCQNCLEAALPSRDLEAGIPDGYAYVRERNRSIHPQDVPAAIDVRQHDDPSPAVRARSRYGNGAFEWQHLQYEPGIRERLDRLEGRGS